MWVYMCMYAVVHVDVGVPGGGRGVDCLRGDVEIPSLEERNSLLNLKRCRLVQGADLRV